MDELTGALSTAKQDGRYAYIAPYREQAKTAAWNYVQRFATPIVRDPANDIRQSDLSVRLPNKAEMRLFGADNPNALRGGYWDGVIMDEYADMRPSLWGEVIRPALSDRQGWAVFIGTPRGTNAFKHVWDEAQDDPRWFKMMLKASESGIISPEELADARKDMTEAQYEQEYECSFTAAILGAIYAKELAAAEPRIVSLPYDSQYLVNTAWDIGIGDAMAVWFWQQVGHEIRVIDYYEANGEQVPYYLGILRGKGYAYDTCYLPHDGNNRQLTGLTVAEVMREAGFGVQVLPRGGLEEGINATRMLFSRMWFDKQKCAAGLEALRHYQWGYNDRMDELKAAPVHNWASHGADAMRALAQATSMAKRSESTMNLPSLDALWKKNGWGK